MRQGYIRIICAEEKVDCFCEKVAQILSECCILQKDSLKIQPYWKNPECVQLEAPICICDEQKQTQLQLLICQLFGNAGTTNITESESTFEFACYSSIPEIITKSESAFVQCYVSA